MFKKAIFALGVAYAVFILCALLGWPTVEHTFQTDHLSAVRLTASWYDSNSSSWKTQTITIASPKALDELRAALQPIRASMFDLNSMEGDRRYMLELQSPTQTSVIKLTRSEIEPRGKPPQALLAWIDKQIPTL